MENWVVLHLQLRALGYGRGYSIIKFSESPKLRRQQPDATMSFESH